MPKARVRKVLVYCVSGGSLLVMRHPDFQPEQVGLQVPGGTVAPGEPLEAAAIRELQEETGRADFRLVRYLGVGEYDITPYRDEIQERHFFLVEPTGELPERWLASEDHDGLRPPTRLEFFWIPLATGHVLQSGQGAMLGAV